MVFRYLDERSFRFNNRAMTEAESFSATGTEATP
jgi:hypothetical protein